MTTPGHDSFRRLCASGRDGGGHIVIRVAKATWECVVSNLAQLVAVIRSKRKGRGARPLASRKAPRRAVMGVANIMIIFVAVLIIGGGVRLVRGRWF